MNTTVEALPQEKSAGFEWSALKSLLPYLWPAGGLEMRVRVVIAVGLLIGAKVATVYVPILLKGMVDLFSDPANLPIALPMGLIVGYALLRLASGAFS
jgi:ATP-binding cassette subfamily B protein